MADWDDYLQTNRDVDTALYVAKRHISEKYGLKGLKASYCKMLDPTTFEVGIGDRAVKVKKGAVVDDMVVPV